MDHVHDPTVTEAIDENPVGQSGGEHGTLLAGAIGNASAERHRPKRALTEQNEHQSVPRRDERSHDECMLDGLVRVVRAEDRAGITAGVRRTKQWMVATASKRITSR